MSATDTHHWWDRRPRALQPAPLNRRYLVIFHIKCSRCEDIRASDSKLGTTIVFDECFLAMYSSAWSGAWCTRSARASGLHHYFGFIRFYIMKTNTGHATLPQSCMSEHNTYISKHSRWFEGCTWHVLRLSLEISICDIGQSTSPRTLKFGTLVHVFTPWL